MGAGKTCAWTAEAPSTGRGSTRRWPPRFAPVVVLEQIDALPDDERSYENNEQVWETLSGSSKQRF